MIFSHLKCRIIGHDTRMTNPLTHDFIGLYCISCPYVEILLRDNTTKRAHYEAKRYPKPDPNWILDYNTVEKELPRMLLKQAD